MSEAKTIDEISAVLREIGYAVLEGPRKGKAALPYRFHILKDCLPVDKFSARSLQEGYELALQFAREQQARP